MGEAEQVSLERGAVSWHKEGKNVLEESDPIVNICPKDTNFIHHDHKPHGACAVQ